MRVITRAEWGATAPQGPPMTLPVGELWLHHSVTPLTDDPIKDMKAIEKVGVQRFGRFSYSWAYHAKARVLLEGAGNTIGAHTAGRNSTSLGLVLIGNFDELDLSDDNVADIRWAIAWLISGNRLRPGTYPTGGHRDLKSTACPGGHAYARLNDIRAAASEPREDNDAMKATYIRKRTDGRVYLAAVGMTPRPVNRFKDMEYHFVNREGGVILPPPADAAEDVADPVGTVRKVMVVDDGSMFGI